MRISRLIPSIIVSLIVAAAGCASDTESPDVRTDETALMAFEAHAPEHIRPTYDAMAVADKARIWRAQFRRNLLREDLNPAQRAALVELTARAEQYLREGLPEADAARYEALFAGDGKGAVLERLGATRPAAAPIESPEGPIAGTAPLESCGTRWCSCCDCCVPPCFGEQPSWHCEDGCTSTSSGCGTLWLQSCTKQCVFNEPQDPV